MRHINMNNKNKKLILAVAAAAIIAVVVIVTILNKNKSGGESYRVIKVDDYEGIVDLVRNDIEADIFQGMQLISKDKVTTGEESVISLLVDSDKHIVAEENTSFTIETSGSERSGKVKITQNYGTSLYTIDNKLNEKSSFEVDTPNASLSVRGTTFEVTYYPDTNTTVLNVFEGVVEISSLEETRTVEAGGSAVVTDDEFTDGSIPIIDDNQGDIDSTENPEDVTEEEIPVVSNDYASYYIDIIEDVGTDDYVYNLIYVNDDEIPELVIAEAWYHMSLYTYADGQVYTLIDKEPYGVGGNTGYSYAPKQNLLRHDFSESAGARYYTTLYTINAQHEFVKYKEEAYCVELTDGQVVYDSPKYMYGSQEISQTEFNSYMVDIEYESMLGEYSKDDMIAELTTISQQ